jgi:hypothetical protein
MIIGFSKALLHGVGWLPTRAEKKKGGKLDE